MRASGREIAALVVDGILGFLVAAGTVIGIVALVIAVTRTPPATGSPNCPPGQWYVEKPGTGWLCAPGSAPVFTPGGQP